MQVNDISNRETVLRSNLSTSNSGLAGVQQHWKRNIAKEEKYLPFIISIKTICNIRYQYQDFSYKPTIKEVFSIVKKLMMMDILILLFTFVSFFTSTLQQPILAPLVTSELPIQTTLPLYSSTIKAAYLGNLTKLGKVILPSIIKYPSGENTNEDEAAEFLKKAEKLSSLKQNKMILASWNYESDLNDHNKKILLQESINIAEFHKHLWENATNFAWKTFKDPMLKYRFKKLALPGTAALKDKDLKKMDILRTEMGEIFSTAKICPYEHFLEDKVYDPAICNLSLEPELTLIIEDSKDYDKMRYVWTKWRDVSGKMIRDKYLSYVKLANKMAHLNGFDDYGALLRSDYDSQKFESEVEFLFSQIRPFYKLIHAYIRKKLINVYGEERINPRGPIPSHILGNMWAQQIIGDDFLPYQNKLPDLTEIFIKKNMTVLDFYKMSEEFFVSLGFDPMTQEFWNRSIIEKPEGVEIACHASAWDFSDGKDFRIKQCTKLRKDDFLVVHHEMGHIQYYMQYAHLPYDFRLGANPGFHEAVGDVISLSVRTLNHLKKVGLYDNYEDDYETNINFLIEQAFKKLYFIPFSYLIDRYQWDIFSEKIEPENLNSKWWEYRLNIQGLCPPVLRTDDDFDAGSKYHVANTVPYIRYFVSTILQFQIHKGLCEAAQHEGPLHKCDIYKSDKAGKVLRSGLRLGASRPWPEVIKILTNGKSENLDVSAFLEYFAPLIDWLEKELKNDYVGWESSNPMLCSNHKPLL